MKTIIILLLLSAYQLNAQFTLYTLDNSELPSHNISDIVVDYSNTIWVATDSGLVSIKNSHWTNYSTNNSFLTSNSIKDLNLDNYGNIFIYSGESIFTYNEDQFALVRDNVSGTAFAIDNNGGIIVNTNYYLLRSNEDGWDTLVHRPAVNAILIDKIVIDKMNNIYFKYQNFAELWVINNGSQPKHIEKDVNDNRVIEAYDISLDSNQNLWISGDRKLQYYNVGKNKLTTFDKENSSIFERQLIRKTCVNKNNIPYSVLATNFLGVSYLIFISDDKINEYILDEYFSQEVFNWAVNGMAIDLDDNVWMHINGVGLLKFDPSTSHVNLLPNSKYNIYPNPTNNKLNIVLENEALFSSYKITDTKGRQVLVREIAPSSSTIVDLEALPAGVYMIEIVTSSGKVVLDKFVKR